MTGWTPGAPVIERLLQERRLERVLGAHADGSPWLDRARQTMTAARAIEQANPDSAFVLAYDAARQACTALLAQQGMRPTTSGGHYAVEESVRAQFGTIMRPFGALRRRRNELEYPLDPADKASAAETADGIRAAAGLIDAAVKILPNLSLF
ncbi:MAG TPA: hypothetical protein VMA32_09240 [Streptosporangiaceae bacterium]|nr:hypothetical protein [Streptosporangiaceae bacterium]